MPKVRFAGRGYADVRYQCYRSWQPQKFRVQYELDGKVASIFVEAENKSQAKTKAMAAFARIGLAKAKIVVIDSYGNAAARRGR